MTSSGVGLEVRDLSVRAGAVQILRGVSFHVEPGEHVAVIGPSGAGKSTLLRVLAGLVKPQMGTLASAGVVWSHGQRIALPPEQRAAGMVSQDLALWPHLSAREHLLLALRWRGYPSRERANEADRILALVALGARASHRPAQLSGGEAQRLALGRALAGDTRLLLLDEPLTALDLPLRRALGDMFADVARARGATVLHVTHDPSDAARLAQRILVLEQGVVTQFDAPGVLCLRPGSDFVAALFDAGRNDRGRGRRETRAPGQPDGS